MRLTGTSVLPEDVAMLSGYLSQLRYPKRLGKFEIRGLL